MVQNGLSSVQQVVERKTLRKALRNDMENKSHSFVERKIKNRELKVLYKYCQF